MKINMLHEKSAPLISEPLAQTINRNYKLPSECKQPNFSYGQRIPGNDVTTAEYLIQ